MCCGCTITYLSAPFAKKLNNSLLSSYLSQLCKCKNHNRLKVNKEINDINGINRMNRHILSK